MSEYKPYSTIFSSKTAKATMVGLTLAGLGCTLAGILLFIFFHAKSHLPLRAHVEGVSIGNMTIPQAKQVLQEHFSAPPEHNITLHLDDIQIASSSAELGARYEIEQLLNTMTGEPQKLKTRTKFFTVLRRYFTSHDTVLPVGYDETKVAVFLAAFKAKTDISPIAPNFALKTSGVAESLVVSTGTKGREVPTAQTKELVLQALKFGTYEIEVPVASTGAVLAEDQVANTLERGKKFVGKSIRFTWEGIPFSLHDKTILSLVGIPEGMHAEKIESTLREWEKQVNRPPQEPELEYNTETLSVTKFVPPRNGLTLNIPQTKQDVGELLAEIEANTEATKTSFERKLQLAELPPQKPLRELNTLGINDRIGFGESYYAHSIPNRIHNVALATSRVSLDIIKPGEEFSFNKHLGDVSAATGFRSAYVIQGNKTVLGDGGGVCQVSTTLFRSVLNAGLPVTKRLPHSYRVSYYELDRKPGIDATVYSGETDFRFKNDTGQHILVYGETDNKNLYMFFELYGTTDGRTTEIVDHKTWNFKPAPAPVYIPDPTLPPGKTVQVDWAAAGISASFKNIVKDKNGAIIREETYLSNYRPWSAKYLQGI